MGGRRFASSARRLGQRMSQYDASRSAAVHIDHFVETGDRYALPPQLMRPRRMPAVPPLEVSGDEAEAPPTAVRQGAR